MKSLLFFLVLIACFDVAAQSSLTKQEIVDRWKLDKANSYHTDTVSFSGDKKLKKRVSYLIDSLQTNGIDSLIVYAEAHPGTIGADHCVKYMYPEYAYLMWHGQGATPIRKIVGKCEVISSLLSDSIFDFWSENGQVIQTETLMPVIFAPGKTAGGGTKYSVNVVSHEPQYSIVLKTFKTVKQIQFDNNSITNKEGLFYEDNIKSKSVRLWQRIEGMLKAAALL